LGEEAVRAIFPSVTILRPSFMFGPEDHFLNGMARSSAVLHVAPLINNGCAKLQPVHVADVATAVVQCVRHPETAGHTFDLGGSEVFHLREITNIMFDIVQQKPRAIPSSVFDFVH